MGQFDDCNAFDVAQGIYWFCTNHHDGPWSETSYVLRTLDYDPAKDECGPFGRGASVYKEMVEYQFTLAQALSLLTERRNAEMDEMDAWLWQRSQAQSPAITLWWLGQQIAAVAPLALYVKTVLFSVAPAWDSADWRWHIPREIPLR